MKKRNSLIELYRVFFALNVVKNHSFFPQGLNYFSPGRISVEFFFVLSGFLFVHTLDRLKDRPLKESLGQLITSKLKPLMIPLIIGLACNLVYNIVAKEYFGGLWGYLWYVHDMLVTFIGYVIIRKYAKSDKSFLHITLGIFITATLMRFSGIFYSWGYVRAASAISLGMLLTKLPPIRLERQGLLWLVLIPIQLACLTVVCFGLGNVEWWGGFRGVELILDIVLYPSLIYFTFQLDANCRIFNYLGSLSFGLYAFQCPADLMRLLGVSNRYFLLIFIIAAAVIEDAGKRIWRNKTAQQKGLHSLQK